MAAINMPQKKDPLDTLMKGLQIAQSGFGIYSDWQRIGAMNQAKDDAENNVIDTRAKAGLFKEGFVPTTEDDVSAVKFNERGEDGELRPVFLKIPGSRKDIKTMDYEDQSGNKRVGKLDAAGNLVKSPNDEIVAYKKDDPVQKDFSRQQGNTLRGEYNQLSTQNNLRLQAYQVVKSAADNKDPTAATDVSLIYGYMKMVDPGSTVRESEYASAEQARGVPDSVISLFNKAKDGQKLTPEQRANFFAESRNMAKASIVNQTDIDDRYSSLASQSGVRPEMVIDPKWKKIAGRIDDDVKNLAVKQPTAAPSTAAQIAAQDELRKRQGAASATAVKSGSPPRLGVNNAQ